jgi:hypothetical protein
VCNSMNTAYCKVADINVLDNKGKRIDKDQLPRLLKAEVPAMIYVGANFDPLHLRVIKDGVFVFLLSGGAYSEPPWVFGPASLPPPAKPEARVRAVVLVGNDKTSDDVILKAISVYPGQVISDPVLKKAGQSLKRLNLFENATITLIESQGDLKDILVTVKEK